MSLKKNVIANYLGQGWTALMNIAFVPLYIKYLGMEAYGLIGVFAILQAWLTLLDMGMTPTISREMARFTSGAHTTQSIRNLLRSLEVICFAIAGLIWLSLWGASGWLGGNWLQAEKLPVDVVVQAISVMGFVVALRFVESLYRGAIFGLQKQVWFNAVNASLATVRGSGMVGILAWVSPTIKAFFLWQGAMSIISVAVLALAVHRNMPPSVESAKFSFPALASVWRFAGGMMATTLLVLLLTQVDKVLLSRLLSLKAFGYYTLAAMIANALYQLIVPITQAFYPRFTELVTYNDMPGLVAAYHRGSQLISVLVVPGALMLIIFGENVLALWTGDISLAHEIAPLLALLTLGTLLNGLMTIPYMLQLAYGWSSFAAWMNLVAVSVLVPAILWVTPRYGAIGAAWIWVILNAGYVFIAIHFMHRRLLPEEKWRWYFRDIALPVLAAATVVILSQISHSDYSLVKFAEFSWLVVTGIAALVAASLAVTEIRNQILELFLERVRKL